MSDSGGVIAYGFREGFRSERLAYHVFSAFGPVFPIVTADDFGIDLLCHMAHRKEKLLHVGHAYAIQVKSNEDPVVYSGSESGKWLDELDFPLFLACVNKATGDIRLYSTCNLNKLLWGCRWHLPPNYPTEITLQPQPPGTMPSDPQTVGGRALVELGGPALDFNADDVGNPEKREHLCKALEGWVEIDRRNYSRRRSQIPCFLVPTRWESNTSPEERCEWYKGHYSGQSHIEASRETLGDLLTSWGIFYKWAMEQPNRGDTATLKDQFAALRAVVEKLFAPGQLDEFKRKLFNIL